ncbi:hypothetical protein HK405_003447, partial [Cladochytrium tenue]
MLRLLIVWLFIHNVALIETNGIPTSASQSPSISVPIDTSSTSLPPVAPIAKIIPAKEATAVESMRGIYAATPAVYETVNDPTIYSSLAAGTANTRFRLEQFKPCARLCRTPFEPFDEKKATGRIKCSRNLYQDYKPGCPHRAGGGLASATVIAAARFTPPGSGDGSNCIIGRIEIVTPSHGLAVSTGSTEDKFRGGGAWAAQLAQESALPRVNRLGAAAAIANSESSRRESQMTSSAGIVAIIPYDGFGVAVVVALLPEPPFPSTSRGAAVLDGWQHAIQARVDVILPFTFADTVAAQIPPHQHVHTHRAHFSHVACVCDLIYGDSNNRGKLSACSESRHRLGRLILANQVPPHPDDFTRGGGKNSASSQHKHLVTATRASQTCSPSALLRCSSGDPSVAATVAPSSSAPSRLAAYDVLVLIGHGAFSSVHLVRLRSVTAGGAASATAGSARERLFALKALRKQIVAVRHQVRYVLCQRKILALLCGGEGGGAPGADAFPVR